MKLYNIDYIPGQNIEALGLVRGAVVQSKNFGKDFMRMVDEAENLGADAVVNIRYGSSAIMQGAAEIVAYGTAVKIV